MNEEDFSKVTDNILNYKMARRIIKAKGITKNENLVLLSLLDISREFYGGIFCKIDMHELSKRLGMPANVIYRSLCNLSEKRIICTIKYFRVHVILFPDIIMNHIDSVFDVLASKYDVKMSPSDIKDIKTFIEAC
jgi:hypothetical protein